MRETINIEIFYDTNLDESAWLIKEVPNKTGYLVLNKKYNMALTKSFISTDVKGKPLNPNIPSNSSDNPLLQVWDIQFKQGEYAEVAYTFRNLGCASSSSGCYLDLQDFKVKDAATPCVLTRLDKYRPPIFGVGNHYYINVASTPQRYVTDTLNTAKIFGSSITGEDKQKWEIKKSSQGGDNTWYAMTLYKYPDDSKNYYLTNLSGNPKSVAGGQSALQSWIIVSDPTFYDLYFSINFISSSLFLTAPATKINNAGFTLESASSPSGRLLDQRFTFT